MKPIFHAIAGSTAMLIIACFWTSTLISELFMDHTAVAAVKHAIVYGLFLLVPFMAATGGSGFALSKARARIRCWSGRNGAWPSSARTACC